MYLFIYFTNIWHVLDGEHHRRQAVCKQSGEPLRQNSWVSGAILSFDYLVIQRFATLGNILSAMVSSSCLFGDSSSSHENKKSLQNRLNRCFQIFVSRSKSRLYLILEHSCLCLHMWTDDIWILSRAKFILEFMNTKAVWWWIHTFPNASSNLNNECPSP